MRSHIYQMKKAVSERFFEKIQVQENGCWLWLASKGKNGYGRFGTGRGITRFAHRWSYEFHKGVVPEGLVLDHLCRNHSCVNPDHLEPVTRRENTLRGINPPARNAKATHCKHGHPFTKENTYFYGPLRQRLCIACRKTRWEKASQRRKETKTHCKRGHLLTEENTIHAKDGRKVCRICKTTLAEKNFRSEALKADQPGKRAAA